MALWAWLDLKPADVAAFVISSILGGIAGFLFLPNASLFSLVSGMVTFHLFLAWLVFEQDRSPCPPQQPSSTTWRVSRLSTRSTGSLAPLVHPS